MNYNNKIFYCTVVLQYKGRINSKINNFFLFPWHISQYFLVKSELHFQPGKNPEFCLWLNFDGWGIKGICVVALWEIACISQRIKAKKVYKWLLQQKKVTKLMMKLTKVLSPSYPFCRMTSRWSISTNKPEWANEIEFCFSSAKVFENNNNFQL